MSYYLHIFSKPTKDKKDDRCPCGGVILADTEDRPVPVCYECFIKEGEQQ